MLAIVFNILECLEIASSSHCAGFIPSVENVCQEFKYSQERLVKVACFTSCCIHVSVVAATYSVAGIITKTWGGYSCFFLLLKL